MWVHNNIANRNQWYWVGMFCGDGSKNISRHYTVTGLWCYLHFVCRIFIVIEQGQIIIWTHSALKPPCRGQELLGNVKKEWQIKRMAVFSSSLMKRVSNFMRNPRLAHILVGIWTINFGNFSSVLIYLCQARSGTRFLVAHCVVTLEYSNVSIPCPAFILPQMLYCIRV